MNQNTVLWIYIVLLVAGGLVGFLKAKSKASIITSALFAALLAICALGLIPDISFHVACVTLLVLVWFFGSRLAKSKKFMPNGLMFILTVITLVLYKWVLKPHGFGG